MSVRTIQACWDDGGKVNVGDGLEENVFNKTREAYGELDLRERDKANTRILEVVHEEKIEGHNHKPR